MSDHDIVGRLTCMAGISPDGSVTRLVPGGRDLINEAAEEITRLRKENEALRATVDSLDEELGVFDGHENTKRQRDKYAGQVAVLRKHLQDAHDTIEEWGMANATETNYSSFPIRAALSDTAATAEAHDKRVRAESEARGFKAGMEAAAYHAEELRFPSVAGSIRSLAQEGGQ